MYKFYVNTARLGFCTNDLLMSVDHGPKGSYPKQQQSEIESLTQSLVRH